MIETSTIAMGRRIVTRRLSVTLGEGVATITNSAG